MTRDDTPRTQQLCGVSPRLYMLVDIANREGLLRASGVYSACVTPAERRRDTD